MTDIINDLEIVKRRIERLNGFGEEAEVIDNVISLLKAQEPKTVVVEDMPEGESWFGIWFGRCPNCNEQLVKKEHKHFCGHCGQAVKWND